MPFHVKLILLLAALGTKITELSDTLKQHECKRITKRHLKRNKRRSVIDKVCYKMQQCAFKVSRVRHRALDAESEADDRLYTILKGEV